MVYVHKQLQFSKGRSSSKLPGNSIGTAKYSDDPFCLRVAVESSGVEQRTIAPQRPRCTAAYEPSSVKGRIWELSQQPHGSREVQRALSRAKNSEEFMDLAAEMSGHVVEAMECPHANYVLQSCILAEMPAVVQLIVREMIDAGVDVVLQAARHRFGCRVIERLFEICIVPEVGLLEEISALADCLVDDACALCLHPYGNYTMQHVLLHGSEEHCRKLHAFLKDRVVDFAPHFYASAVVGQALQHGSEDDKVELACALVQSPGLLSAMSRSRHGRAAARLASEVALKSERQEALLEGC